MWNQSPIQSELLTALLYLTYTTVQHMRTQKCTSASSIQNFRPELYINILSLASSFNILLSAPLTVKVETWGQLSTTRKVNTYYLSTLSCSMSGSNSMKSSSELKMISGGRSGWLRSNMTSPAETQEWLWHVLLSLAWPDPTWRVRKSCFDTLNHLHSMCVPQYGIPRMNLSQFLPVSKSKVLLCAGSNKLGLNDWIPPTSKAIIS